MTIRLCGSSSTRRRDPVWPHKNLQKAVFAAPEGCRIAATVLTDRTVHACSSLESASSHASIEAWLFLAPLARRSSCRNRQSARLIPTRSSDGFVGWRGRSGCSAWKRVFSAAARATATRMPAPPAPVMAAPSATSVPNPKFAILCSAFRANFGFDKDTSKLMILVSFMDQKFARWTRGSDGADF
jgi:hypothetical protein